MTPPLALRNLAHGNSPRHSVMVVESSDNSLFLKRNFCLREPQSFFVAESLQRRIKQILIQFRRPVFVGIGEGGLVGGFADAEMNQFAQTTAQAIADLAQRIGMSKLAEQHRDELRPAVKALGAPFGTMLLDQRTELGSGNMLEQLIEQTGYLYDWIALLLGIRSRIGPSQTNRFRLDQL